MIGFKSQFFLQWKLSNYLRCSTRLDYIDPILFNVTLIDLLLPEHYKSDFSNYADDTAPYNCSSTFLEIILVVEITLCNLFNWFCHNNFKANASKCYLLLSPFNAKCIKIKSSVLEGISSEKCLGITIDSNFTFEEHKWAL